MSAEAITEAFAVVKRGDVAEVKTIIKKNKNAVFWRDAYDQTMLHSAAFEGHFEMCELLVKYYKPIDLKIRDKNGWQALHCCASQGHLEIYELLLAKGASPNAQNGDLTSPFAYLCRHRFNDKLAELLAASAKAGADPDMQNRYGETALHASCAKGHLETTKFLLDNGATVNMVNLVRTMPFSVGETALHKAVRCGDNATKLCELLIERGADVNVSGYTGTPLSLAIASRVDNVAEYLRDVVKAIKKKKRREQKKRNSKVSIKESGSSNSLNCDSVPPAVDPNTLSVPAPRGGSAPDTTTSTVRQSVSSAFTGPSIDNIDLSSLLSIRENDSAGAALSFVQSDKPGEEDLLLEDVDFNLDLGRDYITLQDDEFGDMVDLRIEDDNFVFHYGEDVSKAVNLAGELNLSFGKEPFVITVLKIAENSKYRGIIRTKTGDHRFFIPAALFSLKPGKEKEVTDKQILKELKASLPELTQKGTRISIVSDPKLHEELVRFESMKKRQLTCMKIGVMYCKAGQTLEEEMFGNKDGSEAHEEFLNILGEKVKLQGFKGYKGDLDVNDNRTGTHSVFTTFRGLEIMFHVSAYLPWSDNDPQQIPRKKFIGNDLSTIVFLEEGATFKPPTVSGDFLHIFGAVQPCKTKDGKPGYRLAVASKKGVPPFGPLMPKPAVFPADSYFRDFLLTKMLNGERAALHSPFLASKMRKTRQAHLQNIVETFSGES